VISEKEAFIDRSFLPNRHNPDILCPPKSLSPDLKFGCLSIKKFYWEIIDAFEEVTSVCSIGIDQEITHVDLG